MYVRLQRTVFQQKASLSPAPVIYDSCCWHSLHFTVRIEIIFNSWWWGGGLSHGPRNKNIVKCVNFPLDPKQCCGTAHLMPFTPTLPMEQPAVTQAAFSHNDLTIQGEVDSISFYQTFESSKIRGPPTLYLVMRWLVGHRSFCVCTRHAVMRCSHQDSNQSFCFNIINLDSP